MVRGQFIELRVELAEREVPGLATLGRRRDGRRCGNDIRLKLVQSFVLSLTRSGSARLGFCRTFLVGTRRKRRIGLPEKGRLGDGNLGCFDARWAHRLFLRFAEADGARSCSRAE